MLTAAPGASATPDDLVLCHSPAITDGDTFRCDGGLRIRLWGMQAPERDEPGGVRSTKALAELTAGETLICRRKGKSHNRAVARCLIGRRDVAREMVRGGFAADWPKFSKGFYAR